MYESKRITLFTYLALTNRVSFSPCSSQFLHVIVRPTCLVPCLIVNSGMTKGSNFGIRYFGSPLTKRSITGAPLRTTHSFRFGSSLRQPLPIYDAVTVYITVKITLFILKITLPMHFLSPSYTRIRHNKFSSFIFNSVLLVFILKWIDLLSFIKLVGKNRA